MNGDAKQVREWGSRVLSGAAMLCLVVTLICPGQAVFAGDKMDILGIYEQARENDPTLAGVRHLRLAVQEGVSLAKSELHPNLSATFQYTDTSQDITNNDNAFYDQAESDFTTMQYGVSLRQPLLRVDSLMGVFQAQVAGEKADVELQAASQDLIVRVAESYLTTLSAQDQLEFARAEETAVRQHYELANGRFEMGLAPITDLYDAKARLASVEARTLEAETLLVDSFEAMRELTGDVPDGIVALSPAFKPALPMPDDADVWVDTSLKENLLVRAQAKQLDVARREVSIQKAGHYPTLDLVGSFSYEDTDGSLFGGGSEIETLEFGAQFTLPLYQGFATVSRARQAFEQAKKSESDLEKVTRETIRLARSSFLGVKTSINRIDALEQAVMAQQSTLEAKQEGYRSGLFTSLAVLDAERDLYMAKSELAQARYEYILSNLKLRQAAGSLSHEDLLSANAWFTE